MVHNYEDYEDDFYTCDADTYDGIDFSLYVADDFVVSHYYTAFGEYKEGRLDVLLTSLFTQDVFKNEYMIYKALKTDAFTRDVNIRMGVDGYNWKAFENNIEQISRYARLNVLNNKYFFSPFREVEIPKAPYTNLDSARAYDAIRTISVATIKDTITQRIIYKAINSYFENIFNQLEQKNTSCLSYGYRKDKSAVQAVINIHNSVRAGYSYALHCDVINFFDEVPHDILQKILDKYLIEESEEGEISGEVIVSTLLRRFYSADRTPYSDYCGNVERYYKHKPKRIPRNKKGLPQGGVLSGILSNVFMHEFDSYVVNDLKEKYHDILYFRYADDFVFLFKDNKSITQLYHDIAGFLEKQLGLRLHAIGDKTRLIDMNQSKEFIDFLGFKISYTGITVNDANVERFKNRILDLLNAFKPQDGSSGEYLDNLVRLVNFKIMGSQAFNKITCPICNKMYKHRSWLSYFLVITDVGILRGLDVWIRTQIYRTFYEHCGERLTKSDLRNNNLASLEQLYYTYKLRKSDALLIYCNCHTEKSNEEMVLRDADTKKEWYEAIESSREYSRRRREGKGYYD